jgi:hypothetical protein
MPDDPTPDTDDGPDGEPTPTTPPSKGQADKDWQGEAEKWKALARKHEKAAADLKPLAEKARELEDAGKSDLERLTAELQSHQSRAQKAETDLIRLRVALRKGLSEVQAKRLLGNTEEELESDADDLLASFKPVEPAPPEEKAEDEEPDRDPNPRRRPQERLRPGAVPDADTEPVETDPRKLAAMVRREYP